MKYAILYEHNQRKVVVMGETYISQMDALLAEKRKNGTLGVRLMVHDSRDFTSDDIAHDFCKMEEARKANKVVRLEHLGF